MNYRTDSKPKKPNDLAIMDNDIIFISDPKWDDLSGQVWRIGVDGEITLVDGNMNTTNGIEGKDFYFELKDF